MEYSTVHKVGESHITLEVHGTKLKVVKSSATENGAATVFSCSFPHTITCSSSTHVSDTFQQSCNLADEVLFVYSIGLYDGSVVLLSVTKSFFHMAPLPTDYKLKDAVRILSSGPGFVFASSISGECALFYTQHITEGGSEQVRCIRMEVSLRARSVLPKHATYFPSNNAGQPSQPIPSFAVYIAPVAQQRGLRPLLVSYLDEAAAAAVAEAPQEPWDTSVVLVGCDDGSVWWLQTPSLRRTWELWALGQEMVSDLALDCSLLDTFASPVQGLLLTVMRMSNEVVLGAAGSVGSGGSGSGALSPCIVVLEQGGAATLLGVRGAGRRCREVRHLPATADLSTLVSHKGVFVYTDRSTGRLCATCADNDESVSGVGVGTGASETEDRRELAVMALTPVASPRIQAFCIASSLSDDGTENDSLLIRAGGVVHSLPLASAGTVGSAGGDGTGSNSSGSGSGTGTSSSWMGSEDSAASVVDQLREACGGGDRRHPHNLVPVQVQAKNEAANLAATSTTCSASATHATASQELALTHLAAALGATGERNEEALRRCVQADLQVLRLTALLQELPAVLTPGREGDKNNSSAGTVLCNPSRSIEISYRFRTEPAPTSAYNSTSSDSGRGGSSSTYVYLDLSIRTHSLPALWALQDRVLLLRLQSTQPTSSLHPAVHCTSMRVQLSPVYSSSSSGSNGNDSSSSSSSSNSSNISSNSSSGSNSEYEYHTSLHVDGSLTRIGDYRLTLSVMVEAPRDTRFLDAGTNCNTSTSTSTTAATISGDAKQAAAESGSVLLAVVDHLVPSAEVLSHVLSTGTHDTLCTLQQLSGEASRDDHTTDSSVSGQEYSLNIAASSSAADGICSAYESAVGRHSQLIEHQHHCDTFLSGGNTLRAAFLEGLEGGGSLFSLGASAANTKSGCRSQKSKLTLQARRTNTTTAAKADRPTAGAFSSPVQASASKGAAAALDPSGTDNRVENVCTLTSSSPALLATVAADLHTNALLADTQGGVADRCILNSPRKEADWSFREGDALHLGPDTQQAMVRAAFLARQCDPARASPADDTSLTNASTVWELYAHIRGAH